MEYVEKWPILVSDRAFYFMLKKNHGNSRTVAFKDQDGTTNAVKRLMYRFDIIIFFYLKCSRISELDAMIMHLSLIHFGSYFKLELLDKGSIERNHMPKF